MSRFVRTLVPLGAGGLIALWPAPAGLAPQAWLCFAVFAAVILALITEPLPAAGIGLIGVTFMAVTGLAFTERQLADPSFRAPAEAIKWALAGFANGTVWLIFGAFIFAMGYEKTGLGRRIALVLVKRLGGRTLGLGYAIALADLALAPFTPSNTARSAGTIFPILRNIPALYDAQPEASPRRIGAYLMWVAFATTCVTSSMFLTALAPNLLVAELARKIAGVEITWMQWCLGFLPLGLPLVLLLPLLVYWLYPPEIRVSVEVPQWAARELVALGSLSRHEWTMGALVVLALGLWICGGAIMDAATVALVTVALMLITGVVIWDDILANKAAWNVLVWFATLITLADGLNRSGFVGWFGQVAATQLGGHAPLVVMLGLVTAFFTVHYFFASLAAHAAALLPTILAAGIAVPGIDVRTFVLLLAYSLGLMGVLTPYATGPAPVYFGSGFIARREFWILGAIFGTIFVASLLLLGALGVP